MLADKPQPEWELLPRLTGKCWWQTWVIVREAYTEPYHPSTLSTLWQAAIRGLDVPSDSSSSGTWRGQRILLGGTDNWSGPGALSGSLLVLFRSAWMIARDRPGLASMNSSISVPASPRSGSSGRIHPGAQTVAALDSMPSTSVRPARVTGIGLVTNEGAIERASTICCCANTSPTRSVSTNPK